MKASCCGCWNKIGGHWILDDNDNPSCQSGSGYLWTSCSLRTPCVFKPLIILSCLKSNPLLIGTEKNRDAKFTGMDLVECIIQKTFSSDLEYSNKQPVVALRRRHFGLGHEVASKTLLEYMVFSSQPRIRMKCVLYSGGSDPESSPGNSRPIRLFTLSFRWTPKPLPRPQSGSW